MRHGAGFSPLLRVLSLFAANAWKAIGRKKAQEAQGKD
jgi:hypothetical protein